ncbi:unnamed protein product [Soboliphyme baturini]|uniref:sphingomyelin phosphodiesterase n=1 Tax=Soboliphyme baturini TaxID=241478 RepID=A0A183ILZ3_9BILA|nr:unnamed protein product [Soboliphyme baturini]
MAVTLKVLTLNSWALPLVYPFGSKHRKLRIEAIADALLHEDYDLVSLQEIWREEDYEYIRRVVLETLPYSFYFYSVVNIWYSFYSGYIGSGVCVFSKYKIVDTLMHPYSLNGYGHHIHHGDWFGGKVVGMAKLLHEDLKINFFATHIHAEYNRANDVYLPHRIVQAYELSQLVKNLSSGADMSIVVGDLNLESQDLGYNLIVSNGRLKDAYCERKDTHCLNDSTQDGCTCEVPTNCFTVLAGESKVVQTGKRIDYILYNHRRSIDLTVERCFTTLSKIPQHPTINYSDHEGLCAIFKLCKNTDGENFVSTGHASSTDTVFPEAIKVIDEGIRKNRSDRNFFMAALICLVVLYVSTTKADGDFDRVLFQVIFAVGRLMLSILIGFCFWHGRVVLSMERKAFLAAKGGMKLLCDSEKSA